MAYTLGSCDSAKLAGPTSIFANETNSPSLAGAPRWEPNTIPNGVKRAISATIYRQNNTGVAEHFDQYAEVVGARESLARTARQPSGVSRRSPLSLFPHKALAFVGFPPGIPSSL